MEDGSSISTSRNLKYDWLHKAPKSATFKISTQSDFCQRDDAEKDVKGDLQYAVIIVQEHCEDNGLHKTMR